MKATDYDLLGLSYLLGPSCGKRKRPFGCRARRKKGDKRSI